MRIPLALTALLLLAACQSDAAPDRAPLAEAAGDVETVGVQPVAADLPADAPTLTVYKSPTCGCCTAWAEYMEREGFRVQTEDVTNLAAVKDSLGVPSDLSSCHTGVVSDGSSRYVVEGHVPVEQVRRLLAEGSDVRGLAVPGMPIGSPGMEQGDRRDPYDVLVVGPEGEAAVYERIPGSGTP